MLRLRANCANTTAKRILLKSYAAHRSAQGVATAHHSSLSVFVFGGAVRSSSTTSSSSSAAPPPSPDAKYQIYGGYAGEAPPPPPSPTQEEANNNNAATPPPRDVDNSKAIVGENSSDSEGGEEPPKTTALTTPNAYFATYGVVEEYSRQALEREGRADRVEAELWTEESGYVPILARGQRNIYDFTDDIPEHVKPMYHYQVHQQRFYFQMKRQQYTWQRTAFTVACFFGLTFAFVSAVTFTRIWIQQPGELMELRTRLIQTNAYGRVLELAAGQGINVGSYPYAVHEIAMVDSNSSELQRLRYRLPKTAYPKYHVVQDRAEYLSNFKDNEFDCAVDMFGLCHYKDPVMVLRQLQRVVKPTGTILLLEHGRTKYPPVNWFLDAYSGKHLQKTGGCQWNLDINQLMKEARLVVREQTNYHYGTTYYVVAHPETLEAPAQPSALAA